MKLLLIITGGIAAYKTPELVRRLREQGAEVTCVLTKAAAEFVSPLALSAVSESPVFDNLWDLREGRDMSHIRLSREADAILVAPASADFMAKVAQGLADDLPSALMLASDKPATFAPAMNHKMWSNPATQRNQALLRADGHEILQPKNGSMACGEFGVGRMVDVPDLVAHFFGPKPLAGKHALITSGPTQEALDPVRYLSNHSSGKQGHAIATALVNAGADVTVVSGPTNLPAPQGVTQIDVLSAQEMLRACESALPADILICAAAVADYRLANPGTEKMKKDGAGLALDLVENPDILKTLCAHPKRPDLTIGFAAETSELESRAIAKRQRKGCDWLLANDVGAEPEIFGGDENRVQFITAQGAEAWPRASKTDIAARLTMCLIEHFEQDKPAP